MWAESKRGALTLPLQSALWIKISFSNHGHVESKYEKREKKEKEKFKINYATFSLFSNI